MEHDDRAADFLRRSIEKRFSELPTVDIVTQAPADTDLTERTIDKYRILEKLGEVGMGQVYEAEQLEPVRRKVALKLIKGRKDHSGTRPDRTSRTACQ